MSTPDPTPPLQIRLWLPSPRPRGDRVWGDHYFGMGLADALMRLGHQVTVVPHRRRSWLWRWLDLASPPDADLVLRGKKRFVPRKRSKRLLWVISNAGTLSDRELASADHIFVASEQFLEDLISRGIQKASLLHQATDPLLFRPDRARPELDCDAIFVGNRHFERPVVGFALASGLKLKLFGMGWKGQVPDAIIGGIHIPNSELGAYYASARMVLNDHTPAMRLSGFISNRLFDVLACGTALVTDMAQRLPKGLEKLVYGYHDQASFELACAAASKGSPPEVRRQVADIVRHEHSFDARGVRIAEVIHNLRAAA